MRTPGRCSNIEGCWISASHRDVWLNVGEDFTCPNCGSMLSAPPGRAVHARGVRKAAFTATATAMGIAAAAVAAVKLSTLTLSGQPALTAMLHAPAAVMSAMFRTQPTLLAILQPRPAPDRPAMPVPFMRPATAPQPANTQFANGKPAPGTVEAPAPVLLYTANPPVPAATKPAIQVAANQPPAPKAAAPEAPPPAPYITFVSEAAFVLPPMTKQRPVILPISFGRPVAPETDAEPADRRWRHHGFFHTRHTGFLPPPGSASGEDAVSEIRTSAELR